MNFEFEVPFESKMIKVIGVGGGGSNAVNHMFNQGIKDVDFIVCNTDKQALLSSPVLTRVHIGTLITEGLGAGANAEIGKQSALESVEEINRILTPNTKMIFITAGMGGGTGTGAAPVIASIAREMGILTVGIVTAPFTFEGKRRREQAEIGIEEMRKSVDALIVVKNDQLRYLFGNLSIKDAFSKADDILTIAAKGIAEIITVKGYVNVDFMDVKTVMKNSGVAIMGTGTATGEQRAVEAVKKALDCPLLSDNDIYGAENILLNISYGDLALSMDENGEITDYITKEIGLETENLIWGISEDKELGDALRVTIVATGFDKKKIQRSPVGQEIIPKKDTQDSKALYLFDQEPLAAPSASFISSLAAQKPVMELIPEPNPQLAPSVFSNSRFSFEELPEDLDTTASTVASSGNLLHTSENIDQQAVTAAKTAVEKTTKSLFHFSEEGKTEVVKKNTLFNFEEMEQIRQTTQQERLEKVEKAVINRMKNPGGLNDLEREPAYLRRNIKLFETPHSSEDSFARFTVEDAVGNRKKNNDFRVGLRANNSFLHDNVD